MVDSNRGDHANGPCNEISINISAYLPPGFNESDVLEFSSDVPGGMTAFLHHTILTTLTHSYVLRYSRRSALSACA